MVTSTQRWEERVKHGMRDRSENGERFCDFSVANGHVITGTSWFQHKDIHKAA